MLGISPPTVMRRLGEGSLPGKRRGMRWVFQRPEIEKMAGATTSSRHQEQPFAGSRQIPPDSHVLTTDEVADYLRVSRMTVARYFKSGVLPGLKFAKALRFSRGKVEALLVKGSNSWGVTSCSMPSTCW